MKMILDLDVNQCSGCGACSAACMDQNDYIVQEGTRPYRCVFSLEQKKRGQWHSENLSMACMHCDDAPCVTACPAGCISKDADTGLTVYDNTNCIGCHSCAMACPFGAPRFNGEGKMVKCDGCIDRLRAGLEPACVRVCPFDALKMYSQEEYDALQSQKSLTRMARLLLEEE